MAAVKNPKEGRGSCPSCGESVVFRRSPSTGKLSYKCDECDSSGYADKGSTSDAKWSATIAAKPAPTPSPAPSPTPAPGPAPTPSPAPTPAARKPFSLSDLA